MYVVLFDSILLVVVMFAMGMFAFQGKKAAESTALASANAANLVQFYSPTTGAADAKVTKRHRLWSTVLVNHAPVTGYEQGTWGSREADVLTAGDGGWHQPAPEGGCP